MVPNTDYANPCGPRYDQGIPESGCWSEGSKINSTYFNSIMFLIEYMNFYEIR